MARAAAELFAVAEGVRGSVPIGGSTANPPPTPPATPVVLGPCPLKRYTLWRGFRLLE